MFAKNTHIVAAPPGFVCVPTPMQLHFVSFIKIHLGFRSNEIKICYLPLFGLMAFTTVSCETKGSTENAFILSIYHSDNTHTMSKNTSEVI